MASPLSANIIIHENIGQHIKEHIFYFAVYMTHKINRNHLCM